MPGARDQPECRVPTCLVLPAQVGTAFLAQRERVWLAQREGVLLAQEETLLQAQRETLLLAQTVEAALPAQVVTEPGQPSLVQPVTLPVQPIIHRP